MIDSTADNPEPVSTPTRLARRRFLQLAGLSGVAAVASPLVAGPAGAAVRRGPVLMSRPDSAGAPVADQLHLTFGADPARSMIATWSTPVLVRRPVLRLGTPAGGFGHTVPAEPKLYTDAMTGQTVVTYHASLHGLHPDHEYVYEVLADGADPVGGRFRTAPSGRAPFRFTSFGDQSIPVAVGSGASPGPHTPNAGYVVDAIAGLDRPPLFHLLNGDLCYANVSDDPVDTWRTFFHTNMPLAANLPWMPAAGNHENEVGNGPQGYQAYQTWFTLPENGAPEPWRGNWYSFKVGSVGVVSLNNDDVCYQQGSFSAFREENLDPSANHGDYIHGYSRGAQRAWLQQTLAALRDDRDVDWIVVCMHQVAMSSANFNGADLGIREQWLPLFDRFGVDLVVAGHEHHYERTHPVRGFDRHHMAPSGKALLTPLAVGQSASDTVIDTTTGTVHMILGGGGHSNFTPPASFDPPTQGVVIYDVGAPVDGSRPSLKVLDEPSDWSAHRDLTYEYGFGVFDVDPGRPGGTTSINFTYYGAVLDTRDGAAGYQPRDRVTLVRPRKDGHPGDR
jgi:hypothetical protein